MILGVWDGHDSGAAFIGDGRDGLEILFAANEERYTRRKLEVRFPFESIRRGLAFLSASGKDIEAVAVSTSDPSKTLARIAPSTKEAYYRIRRRKGRPRLLDGLRKALKYEVTTLAPSGLSTMVSRALLRASLEEVGITAPLHIIDHHLAHAWGAAATAPWDELIVITLDGVGDGASGIVAVATGGDLEEIGRTRARDSIGIVYEHATNLLNMRELEDEGKVMALAAYSRIDPSSNPLDDLIRVDTDSLSFLCSCGPVELKRRLARILWNLPPERFAACIQDLIEKRVLELAEAAVRLTGIRRIALSGGVASNIKMNQRLREASFTDGVFVFPHMGDGGLALGAAAAFAHRRLRLPGPYLGTTWDDPSGGGVGGAIDEARAAGLLVTEPGDPADDAAEKIKGGAIIGWCNGRMEIGPRALGARSILARPDKSDIRDRLNLVLKDRVFYQPFCPSILTSAAGRYLDSYDGSPDYWMTMSYSTTTEGKKALAGVTGPDGSTRPQIVDPENPIGEEGAAYAELLLAFEKRTGIGAILNTSFNRHGEPIVASGVDAVRTYLSSGLDLLYLGPWRISREGPY